MIGALAVVGLVIEWQEDYWQPLKLNETGMFVSGSPQSLICVLY